MVCLQSTSRIRLTSFDHVFSSMVLITMLLHEQLLIGNTLQYDMPTTSEVRTTILKYDTQSFHLADPRSVRSLQSTHSVDP